MANTPDLTLADVDDQTESQLAQLDAARRRIADLLGERYLTEAVARRVVDEVSLHRERNGVLLDALPLCIVLFDEESMCRFFNRAAADYLAVDDRFIGRPVRAICCAALVASGLADALRRAIDCRESHTWTYIDPAPRPQTFRAGVTPLSGMSGRDGCVMLTLDRAAAATCDRKPVVNAATVALASLSPREREVLDFVAAGCSSQAIAEKLHRSLKTVQLHRYHIAAKLGTSNVARWVHMLLDAGVLRPMR